MAQSLRQAKHRTKVRRCAQAVTISTTLTETGIIIGSGLHFMNATTAQINYLEILFRDLGFNRRQRNAFLTAELERPVRFLDELTSAEASRIITSLKERKDEASSQSL